MGARQLGIPAVVSVPGLLDAAADGSLVAIDGDTVVATGTTRYREAAGGPITRIYDNCFVMRFDEDGRCQDFTEYYIRRP